MSIAGINISNFNGAVNWKSAADSISFAYAKATQGTSYTDPRFAQNWKGMQRAGVPRGAFHFFDPRKDASAQAELFLRRVQPEATDLPPMLDVEWQNGVSSAATIHGVYRWMNLVEHATGRTPVLQTSASFWKRIGNPPRPSGSALWVTQHGTSTPSLPKSWKSWTFWQFSPKGRCAGIEGYVDLNRFSGSEGQLAQI